MGQRKLTLMVVDVESEPRYYLSFFAMVKYSNVWSLFVVNRYFNFSDTPLRMK